MNAIRCLVRAIPSLLLAGVAAAQGVPAPSEPPRRTEPWPKSVIDAVAGLPVQDGGRIKPFESFARFKLLQLSGKRTLTLEVEGSEEKVKLSATEWLLDLLFFPRQALDYPVFLVEDYDALSDVGLSTEGLRKRERHAFGVLAPAAERLEQRHKAYGKKMPTERTSVENEVLRIATNYSDFLGLLSLTQFARIRVDLAKDFPALAPVFPERAQVGIAEIAAKLPEVFARLNSMVDEHGLDGAPSDEMREIAGFLEQVDYSARGWTGLALFPPPRGEQTWLSPGALVARSFLSTEEVEPQLAALAKFEALVPWGGQPFDIAEFEQGIKDLRGDVERLAAARGEAQKIGLEVAFYRADLFFYAQMLFVLALVLTSLLWLAPRVRVLYGAAWVANVIPWLVLAVGIVLRCILRGRPPVSTLYESILFITACAVFAACVAEAINRQRIALFIASLIGCVGLYLAGWYEDVSRTDTMPQLQAVLDTNFWLSTHVTSVTIGYSAGFLAAGIAHVYLFGKLFGLKRGDSGFYRSIARMVYGAICFGLLFSTVGTILGGVWANDSWGRFWGWDPKENGALMIVLMNLIILHSRLSGLIREFGTCLLAIVLAMVVTFSWFHTNVLGVGLHSYGFDSSIARLVTSIYAVEGCVLLLGAFALWRERARSSASSVSVDAGATPERA